MMGPLLHKHDQELEEELLRAGKDVNLSSASQARLLAVLGVTAGMAATTEVAASGLLAKLFAGKTGVLAAASMASAGVIGAGVYWAAAGPESDSAPRVVMAAPSEQPATKTSSVRGSPERGAEPAAGDAVGNDEVRGSGAATDSGEQRTSASRGSARLSSKETLKAELALVEAASRATKAGNGALALQHLAEYRSKFPRGKLALEAQVLRIEALALAGHRTEASELADRFLKRYPDSPVAARIRRYAE